MFKCFIAIIFAQKIVSFNLEIGKIQIKNHLNYYKPENNFKNSLNYYSIIHFVEYAILGLIKSVKMLHIWMISIGWEIIELFIPYHWARESWLNKLLDLGFNFSGYLVARKYLVKRG
jgi:hypothetical protein